ncbi:hypothetical protein Tsubulata_001937 [Turnera subulata]|uniref:NAB domain-containing protein n=1 Tax=Turnera subulata TaxID=218843 RepID=A0A9Q0FLX2_9ROSI|nr:hypothetical protein Tsubulata_001937 [Turnera subulata]
MLQRAASNAYSWWWASHIRTKQSKWLEENLQDMEEKVGSMLQIIENPGDTFAERSEMYYKKRPELIVQVEESYRAYRALAERYDKLSKDLQSANRTIATVFPEQVQYAMDDDDDFDYNFEAYKPTTSSSTDDPNRPKANIPKVPKKEYRSQSLVQTRKNQLNRCTQLSRVSSAARALPQSSGLTVEEALDEIDKLQKEILALQTEMEFAQSIFERCRGKCEKIENDINEKQKRIGSLQDEFGIGKSIDDNEARTLMAATALKSCQESLVKLQEKQEQSAEEAELEQQRIKGVHQKITTLKSEFVSSEAEAEPEEPADEPEMGKLDPKDMEALREKIKSELDADSSASITVMQLADRIDELVERVANLETEVSSQNALVSTVKSETNDLQAQVKTLEEDKETLKEKSDIMINKLKDLEAEVRRVKKLNRTIILQNKNLIKLFTEASCNINHLSVRLLHMQPDDELDSAVVTEEIRDSLEAIVEKQAEVDKEMEEKNVGAVKTKESDRTQMPAEQHQKDSHNSDLEESGTDEDEDQPNWRQLFSRSLEDREKILIEEYSSVLRNYKDVRKKLGDMEQKNRDGFIDLAMQIRDLKSVLVQKDEEIRSLRKMGGGDHEDQNLDDTTQGNTPETYKFSRREGSPESMTQATSVPDYNLSSLSSPQQTSFDESREKSGDELVVPSKTMRRYSSKEQSRNEMKGRRGESPMIVSAVEEKFRSDIDDLLEDNLEFWLRFSTSFHQITKFQNSVRDLKVELSKVKDKRKDAAGGSVIFSQSLMSEARPIYRHLREIDTDLTLWLENNSIMKEEIQGRYTSLCNIQEEIKRISNEHGEGDDGVLSVYQAAKFQGEVLNMKQENTKVSDELHAGLDKVSGLKNEVGKILGELDEQLGLAAAAKQRTSSSSKSRIPLRSFLFGVKLKRKQKATSLFSCVSPALQKQYSIIGEEPIKPPE